MSKRDTGQLERITFPSDYKNLTIQIYSNEVQQWLLETEERHGIKSSLLCVMNFQFYSDIF